ncbi:MAG: AarF/ABC1/UbiB kinase family protein [Candidatus Cloacimonetes bacterium]|nr:AarF/ABC1/UbiB kinase family protein [Candidatus Cloacimonadota bacterium]
MFEKLKRVFKIVQTSFQVKSLNQQENDHVKSQARNYLIESMGELKGLPQKMGQWMSMSDDPQFKEFESLQNQGKALSKAVILSILSNEWQKDPYDVLDSLSDDPYCASLGQVHKATLKSGDTVAIKVQYPNIKKSIQTDLSLLGWVASPFSKKGANFQLEDYQNEISKNIEQELDYKQEALHQKRFLEDALESKIEGFIVPKVYLEHSTSKVLVSQFEESKPLNDLSSFSTNDKTQLQNILMNVFAYSVFHKGFYHADPHPGNLGFRKLGTKLQVVFYDFGSMGTLEKSKSLSILKLLEGTLNKASFSPYSYYLSLGFNPNYLYPIIKRLPALNEVFFAPFTSLGRFEFKNWNRTALTNQILGDERWNFRLAAPAELIFLMKSFIGLFHFLSTLNPSFFFRPHIQNLLKSYEVELSNLKVAHSENYSYDDMAQSLKISVFENSTQKVQLTFQRHLVNQLKHLIPPDVLTVIQSRSIDIDSIIHQTHLNGYPSGDLFSLQENNKTIRVWLE